MKILLSWVAVNNDLREENGKMTGPNLEVLRNDSFDLWYLFSNNQPSQKKASDVKTYVEARPHEFHVQKIELPFHNLKNPANYQELWETFPEKIESILKKHQHQNPEFFITVSSGTPAMATTWMMMVGTGQIEATVLNPQYNRETKLNFIDEVDTGIYPAFARLEEKINTQLGIEKEFNSPKMREIQRDLAWLAKHKPGKPILLLGESGTGKTTLAKKFHHWFGRGKFYKVECGSFRVSDLNTVKAQFFGVEKGVITGVDKREGALNIVDGGVLFLDEIGDIPVEVQGTLIDTIESKTYQSLGSHDEKRSDFQLICATNRNIEEMLKNNAMRQDFYNRIPHEYEIPPLRERSEDIPVLIRQLLTERYHHISLAEGVEEALVKKLQNAKLLRNIRDIELILERLPVGLPTDQPISWEVLQNYFEKNPQETNLDDFADHMQQLLKLWPHTEWARQGGKWKDTILDMAIRLAIQDDEFRKSSGELNIFGVSKLLGVDSQTIRKRIELMGLSQK